MGNARNSLWLIQDKTVNTRGGKMNFMVLLCIMRMFKDVSKPPAQVGLTCK
ncbi:hypothetical protein Hanom_Chr04g00346491 [Helianthus anomalus]